MEKLSQYLYDVLNLEAQLYTQEQLYWNLKYKADSLGHPQAYNKPVLGKWDPELDSFSFLAFLTPTIGITFIVSIIAILFGYGYGNFKDLIDIYKKSFWVVYLVCIAFYVCNNYMIYKDEKKKYKESLKEYNAFLKADAHRVSEELKYKEILEQEYKEVNTLWYETKKSLNALYEIGIIHNKYRYMVAIASFYDYFDTGVCFSLTGPNGAYARYEEDIRFKILESKLDVIISKLDQLIDKQRTITQLMREANDTLGRIEYCSNQMQNNMSRIVENTELTAYNTRCAMQSAAVMESISVYYALKN